MRSFFLTTLLASATLAGAAAAQTMATAGTDLNLRSAPQSTASILGVIANGDEVSVAGCLESANWCQFTYKDQQGWAYGDYLTAQVGNEPQPLYPNRRPRCAPTSPPTRSSRSCWKARSSWARASPNR